MKKVWYVILGGGGDKYFISRKKQNLNETFRFFKQSEMNSQTLNLSFKHTSTDHIKTHVIVLCPHQHSFS